MDTIIVGIDVAKDRLDVALRPTGEAFVVERAPAGLQQLLDRIQPLAPALIALEATGGFEAVVAATLAAAGCRLSSSTRPRSAPSPRRSVSEPRPIRSTRPSSPASPRPPDPSRGHCPTRRSVSSPTSSHGAARSSI